MVSTQSPAAQAAENDKRRKSATQLTIEKVKASHLARQLQMRLQYARLKVEHGWQKQNLNEVENLYFHNSHLRGPKPFVSIPTPPIPVPTIITTQPSPERTQPPIPPAGQASKPSTTSNIELTTPFPAGPITSTSTPAIRTSGEGSSMNPNPSPSPNPQSSLTPNPSISATFNTLTLASISKSSDAAMSVDPQISSTSSTCQDEPLTIQNPITGPHPAQASILPTHIPSVPSTSTELSSSPTMDFLSSQSPLTSFLNSSTNHYPTVKAPRSRINKHPAGPKGSHQNLTAQDMVDFSSASTLTYDSFWSSHSGGTMATTSGTRPSGPMSIASGIAELASAFHNSGAFPNGIPDLARLANEVTPFVTGVPSNSSNAVACESGTESKC
ncbi:hypothetical protein CPB83DRAFT_100616 [Crepidotus variabilis]|uniref:Uncharacterized protein n=1 Tax=Crepidotus variabilis TaxID=179855 RepID=A0A9P6EM68_9AGAR|nr:hypothetical protein CPB83DRAFT_100616 [Crepidotus variabilis]